jgi:hypothetical protein
MGCKRKSTEATKGEFAIVNVPTAANPFDPDNIRLDATFTLPSGRLMVVPAFW